MREILQTPFIDTSRKKSEQSTIVFLSIYVNNFHLFIVAGSQFGCCVF